MQNHPRVTLDPDVLAGKPVIMGTRLAVDFIIGLLADGWSEADILQNYPGVTHEDIAACLAYANNNARRPGIGVTPAMERSGTAKAASRLVFGRKIVHLLRMADNVENLTLEQLRAIRGENDKDTSLCCSTLCSGLARLSRKTPSSSATSPALACAWITWSAISTGSSGGLISSKLSRAHVGSARQPQVEPQRFHAMRTHAPA